MKIPTTNNIQFETLLLQKNIYYEKLEILENEELPVYVFTNVNMRPNIKNNSIKLDGEWSIVWDAGGHYGHYIKEYAGGFVFCKSKFKNLKPLFVRSGPLKPEDHVQLQQANNVIDFVNEMLYQDFGGIKMPSEEFWSKNIIIDKLIIVMDNGRNLFRRDYPYFFECEAPGISREMIKYFNRLKIDDPTKPKKIFISRKTMTQTIKEQNIQNRMHYKNRYFDEWVEDALEQAFIEAGYTVIDFFGMSFEDQVSYSHNADFFAGIIGTSYHNGIWVKDGTTFYAIRPNTLYDFDWENDITKSLNNIKFNYIDLFECKNYEEVYNLVKSII